MTDEKLQQLAEILNRLVEVRWDRCRVGKDWAWVFGWIARDDGRFDFVVINAETSDGEESVRIGFSTSSASHSAEYSRRLHGKNAAHFDCQRVEDEFGDLVVRKIVLPKVAA